MTNEALAVRIQQGERELLPELWAGVERFVARAAHRRMAAYRLENNDYAVEAGDLIQEGYLAMVRAVETFQRDRGMTFVGWLDFYLKRAFGDALGTRSGGRLQDPMHRAESLDRPMGGETGETVGALLPDGRQTIQEAERAVWLAQLRAVIASALARLPDDEGEILRRRYWGAESRERIGQALGVSRETIRTREARGLAAMRVLLAGF